MQIVLPLIEPVTGPVRFVISAGYCTTLQVPGVVVVQPAGGPSLVGLPAKRSARLRRPTRRRRRRRGKRPSRSCRSRERLEARDPKRVRLARRREEAAQAIQRHRNAECRGVGLSHADLCKVQLRNVRSSAGRRVVRHLRIASRVEHRTYREWACSASSRLESAPVSCRARKR